MTISGDSHKKQLTTHHYLQKTRGIFIILHLILIYVFGPRIAFILGRREYSLERAAVCDTLCVAVVAGLYFEAKHKK